MKQVLSVLLISVFILNLFTTVPVTAVANEVNITTTDVESGTTGSCKWTLNGTVLTISGFGAMGNYCGYKAPFFLKARPWGKYITKVIIENGVTNIGGYAFGDCANLKSIVIADSVTEIEPNAFAECKGLTSIDIPNSVKSIGISSFERCENLTNVTIPNSVTNIGEGAFIMCNSFTNITIPESVTSIGDLAFDECDNLASITLPDSVTSIGESTFNRCKSLTSITIPDSVTEIGTGAFSECDKLERVVLGNSINNIGAYAFEKCKNLTSITIPKSVTSIGKSAFWGCEALTSIEIPDSVVSLGGSAFGKCSNLTTITLSKNLKCIDSAFNYCTNLKSIIIPNSVTCIGSNAFYKCSSLESISIPNSVTSIENSAFYSCSRLQDVYYTGSEEQWKQIQISSYNEDLQNATIHYNTNGSDTPTEPDVPSQSLFFYDSTFYGFVGETNGVLVIFDSADHDITELEYVSSNPDIVDIVVISLGEGNYITQGNEQIATLYLNCKKEGTATITAIAPDGSTATLNVTVETKPAVQKSIAVFTTEKSLCVKTGDKMWLAFGLMDDTTQTLDGQWKKMAITNSDSTVVSLSDYSETEYGYSLELTGLKQGASHLTITDTETGINTIITVSVYDQYVKSYSYAINNAPTLYPKNKYEQHIATNIYDLNGLYVNNYSCKTTSSGYDVSFDVYNSRYYSGAVDIYDEDGIWMGYEEIAKYSEITSLYDTGEQILYLITDPFTKDIFTYQQGSYSKKSHISFEVPQGGYFTISNNVSESPGTFFTNAFEMLFDGAYVAIDLASKGVNKTTALEGFKKAGKETLTTHLLEVHNETMNKAVKKKMQEMWLNTLKSEITKISKGLVKTELKDRITATSNAYSSISSLCENILSSYSLNWKHLLQTSTGIWESAFTELSGPAGVALKGCFAITKGSNNLLRAIQMSASCDNTYATFYSNKSDCNINQHGVVVNTQGNVDAEAVLQVFKVSNDDTVVSAIDSSFDKYELYNICFVKNDQLVQPSGKVTVHIPIPQGIKGNTCKVYRKENNNEWTILDAQIEGNYLVFETDHFSLYTVIGDTESISIASLPTKLDYISGQSLDTTGLVLELNGEEITDGFVCNPAVVSETGTQTITIMYGNLITAFEVNVNAPLLGDVDGDETVTILDVTFIQRHLASIPIPFVLNEMIADADEDGTVAILDATYIQRWLANLKSNDNIGKPINK